MKIFQSSMIKQFSIPKLVQFAFYIYMGDNKVCFEKCIRQFV